MTAVIDAVLSYARHFGPVWPQTPAKTGYRGTNGSKDATRDESSLRHLFGCRPDAVPAVMTGEGAQIVALDIDIKGGRHGLDSLELLGVSTHPQTVTAHTPSGGMHVLFQRPSHPVLSSQDRLGPGLEVKGDGAWITLPPGPGRAWDPYLGPATTLADMPAWMVVAEAATDNLSVALRTVRLQPITRYAEVALDAAVKGIVTAPAGQQRDTLNREIYSIARLVAGGAMPAGLAIESLQWAARQLRSYDARRPWRSAELDKIVRASFADGLARPRQPATRA